MKWPHSQVPNFYDLLAYTAEKTGWEFGEEVKSKQAKLGKVRHNVVLGADAEDSIEEEGVEWELNVGRLNTLKG